VKNVKHSGNITFEDIIACARVMRPRSMAKDFQGTVKEMLGTAVSVGCTVDGEDPRELQEQVRKKKTERSRTRLGLEPVTVKHVYPLCVTKRKLPIHTALT
jgi:predicted ATP-grasp superfamily ATP-dependent carboligase